MNTDKYFGIEPKTKPFLESFPTGHPQLIKLSVNDACALLSNAQTGVKVTKLPADIKDLTTITVDILSNTTPPFSIPTSGKSPSLRPSDPL